MEKKSREEGPAEGGGINSVSDIWALKGNYNSGQCMSSRSPRPDWGGGVV